MFGGEGEARVLRCVRQPRAQGEQQDDRSDMRRCAHSQQHEGGDLPVVDGEEECRDQYEQQPARRDAVGDVRLRGEGGEAAPLQSPLCPLRLLLLFVLFFRREGDFFLFCPFAAQDLVHRHAVQVGECGQV